MTPKLMLMAFFLWRFLRVTEYFYAICDNRLVIYGRVRYELIKNSYTSSIGVN